MAQKKNQNKQSGQLARQSQNQNQQKKKQAGNQPRQGTLGSPSLAAPVAYSSPTQNMAPKINSSAKCSRIVHRELVATISGNTTFGSTAFALNPGVAASFPWLSTVAGSYEQYSFRKLRFHYVTRCATSYTGSVLLAPEYDALDTAPTTEVNMAMMAGAKEDVPWRDQVIDFNVADMFPLGPRKFIRTGAIASTADLKTYDAGQLFVALASCADTSAIGKLWVEYDVDLYIPQNPNAVQSVGVGASTLYVLHSAMSCSTGVAKLVAFDTLGYDSIGVTNTGGSFVLPAGSYMIEAVCTVGSDTNVPFTGQIEIRKNGLASSPVYSAISQVDSESGAQVRFAVPVMGYINSGGSDAVSIYATLTSASGNLFCYNDLCQIRIVRAA